MDSDLYTLADFMDKSSPSLEYSGINAKEKDDNFYSRINNFNEFIDNGIRKQRFYWERPVTSACKNRVMIYDHYTKSTQEMIMMASNNYLGISTHPKVIEAAINAVKKYGTSSGSVPLFSGTFDLHRQLEEKIAHFFNHEDAVLFSSGYMANLGCMAAMGGKNDVIIHDRLNHASLFHGCRFTESAIAIYQHNSPISLERVLKKYDNCRKKIIVTDGVFSMDGDIAILPGIKELSDKYNGLIIVDDAHSTGVLGKTGKGTIEHFNLKKNIDIVTGCFSKALGSVGGFVSSSKEIVKYIRYFGLSSMYSSSLPPADAAASLAALEILQNEPEYLANLRRNIEYMKINLKSMNFNIGNTESAIIPVIIGDEIALRKVIRFLHENGIYANAVPYPAVPKRLSRIRLGIMATHTQEDLDKTLEVFQLYSKKIIENPKEV